MKKKNVLSAVRKSAGLKHIGATVLFGCAKTSCAIRHFVRSVSSIGVAKMPIIGMLQATGTRNCCVPTVGRLNTESEKQFYRVDGWARQYVTVLVEANNEEEAVEKVWDGIDVTEIGPLDYDEFVATDIYPQE